MDKRDKSLKVFLDKARLLYGNKFEYDLDSFTRMRDPINFIDTITGIEYSQRASNHLMSLPKGLADTSSSKLTTEEALERLNNFKHNLIYPKFQEEFENTKSKITSLCSEHGQFIKRYDQFSQFSGCPDCGRSNNALAQFKDESDKPKDTYYTSKYYKDFVSTIDSLLKEYELIEDVDFIKDYELIHEDVKYKVTYYFPKLKYAVNFNRATEIHSSNTQFVSSKLLRTYKDKFYNHNLWKVFFDNNITVFNIYDFYWVLPHKKPIILSKIRHGLGKDEKIFARKCIVTLDEVSISDSKKYLDKWHIEGQGFYYKNSRVFSMKHNDEVVMLAVVGEYFEQGSVDKFSAKLGRIATKLDTTVIGGISKMTKAILKEYGNFHYLITLSSGGSTINASLDTRDIDPRYFWVHPKTLTYYPRNKCQKGVLEKNFGKELFDVIDSKTNKTRQCTEREYMESLGYVRVFDNGLKEVFLTEEHKELNT